MARDVGKFAFCRCMRNSLIFSSELGIESYDFLIDKLHSGGAVFCTQRQVSKAELVYSYSLCIIETSRETRPNV